MFAAEIIGLAVSLGSKLGFLGIDCHAADRIYRFHVRNYTPKAGVFQR
jgi:hypothetical protein